MNKPLQTSSRLGVVDALRGFALLAIVLLHNLEHYNIYFIPNSQPEWLQIIDNTVFLIRRESLCHFLTVIRIQFLHSISQCRKKGNRFPGTFRLANGSIILICPASCIILQWRHSGFIFNCRFYPDSRLQIEKQNRILDRINPAITTF